MEKTWEVCKSDWEKDCLFKKREGRSFGFKAAFVMISVIFIYLFVECSQFCCVYEYECYSYIYNMFKICVHPRRGRSGVFGFLLGLGSKSFEAWKGNRV